MNPENSRKADEGRFARSIGFCVFCYKKVTEKSNLENVKEGQNNQPEKVLERFWKLFNRELNLTRSINNENKDLLKTCTDCFVIVERYCNLYHEVKCLELQLNWQIEKVQSGMTLADRVPSRFIAFRDWCLENDEKLGNANFGRVLQVRRDFKEKCKKYKSKATPRIHLNFSPNIPNKQINTVPTATKSHLETANQFKDANAEVAHLNSSRKYDYFLAWITSLTSLIFLFHLKPEPAQPQKLKDSVSLNIKLTEIQNHEPQIVPQDDEGHEFADDDNNFSDDNESLESSSEESERNERKNRNGQEVSLEPSRITNYDAQDEAIDVKYDLPNDITIEECVSALNLPNHDNPPTSPTECDMPSPQLLGRRSLRQIFKCPVCKATFSSNARLSEHTSKCKNSSSSEDESQDNDFVEKVSHDSIDKVIKFSSRTKSIKLNGPIKAEPQTEDEFSSETDLESDQEVRLAGKKQMIGTKHVIGLCVKCQPNVPFVGFVKMRLHNDYFHSNGYPTLQRHHLPKININIGKMELENFPSKKRLHPCTVNGCSEIFALSIELENHAKIYHTPDIKYVCVFCDLTMNSAMALIDHELEHSNSTQQQENPNFVKGKQFNCGRCENISANKADFTNHYFQVHLDLSPVQATCPICKQTFENLDQVPLTHYANFHDLQRLDDPTKPFRCTKKPEECSAYFLTEDQLHLHWNMSHQISGDSLETAQGTKTKEKERLQRKLKRNANQLPCPHCPKTFPSTYFLRIHVSRRHAKGVEAITKSLNHSSKKIISSVEEGITVDDMVYEKKAKYFCSTENCKRGFMKETDLENHSKLHGEFKCDYCPVVKNYAPELSIHEIVHNITEESSTKTKQTALAFSCVRCPYVTHKRQLYIIHHMESHLGLVADKKLCPICKYLYPWDMIEERPSEFRHAILRHYATFHDLSVLNGQSDEVYKCGRDECQAYFLSSRQLQQHVWEIHENTSATIVKAGKKLHTATKVTRTESQRIRTCTDCNKSFTQATRLKLHRIKVHGEKNTPLREETKEFVCPEEKCGKLYLTQEGLLAHIKAGNHGSRIRSYKIRICEECGKSFKNKGRFDRHMARHASQEMCNYGPYVCTVCQQRFSSEPKLIEHLKITHQLKMSFECKKCGADYSIRYNMTRHVKVKHGLQNNPSDGYTTKLSSLNDDTSTGEDSHLKPSSSYQAKAHKSVKRSKVNISKCESSPGKFSERRSLRQVFQCEVCKATFSSSARLQDHSSTCHSENNENSDVSGLEDNWDDDNNDTREENVDSIDKTDATINISGKVESVDRDPEWTDDLKTELGSDDHPNSESDDDSDNKLHKTPEPQDDKDMTVENAGKPTETEIPDNVSPKKVEPSKKLKVCRFVCLVPSCHNKTFAKGHHLRRHNYRAHIRGTKAKTCEKCGESFTKQRLFDRHMKRHASGKTFIRRGPQVCTVCKMEVSSDPKLIEHMKTTHEIRLSFLCKVCGKDYSLRHNAQYHVKAQHGFKKSGEGYTIKLSSMTDDTGLDEVLSHAIDQTKKNTLGQSEPLENDPELIVELKTELESGDEPGSEAENDSQEKVTKTPEPQEDKFITDENTDENNTEDYPGTTIISSREDGITIDDVIYDKKCKYLCSVESCKGAFMFEQDLTNHFKLHGEFKCNYCYIVKNYAPDLAIHETMHILRDQDKNAGSPIFSCGRCAFSSQEKSLYVEHHLKKHLGLIADKKRCPICKQIYKCQGHVTLRETVFRHYSLYHDLNALIGKEAQKCNRPECKAYFLTSFQLERHNSENHERTPLEEMNTCLDCGKKFSTSRLLKQHRTRVHGVSYSQSVLVSDLLECPAKNCGKTLLNKAALSQHLKSHRNGEKIPTKLVVCEKCGKSWKHESQLRKHMVFHDGPESWKFSCPICKKKQVTRWRLKEHLKTHTKEKPFVCHVCGAAYPYRKAFINHVNKKHGQQNAIVIRKYNKSSTYASLRKVNPKNINESAEHS